MKMMILLERIVASIVFILMLPIFIIIYIFIKIDDPLGPAILKQKRIGVNSKEFIIYKFRTMKNGTPEMPTNKILNKDEVITKFGRILRKTSLDELPQLVNIIKGEMSFIGPRPVISKEIDVISLRKEYYVDTILPGITGWAQINGRDSLGTEEKVMYDIEYLNNKSIMFDMYILALTIVKVIKKEGIR